MSIEYTPASSEQKERKLFSYGVKTPKVPQCQPKHVYIQMTDGTCVIGQIDTINYDVDMNIKSFTIDVRSLNGEVLNDDQHLKHIQLLECCDCKIIDPTKE